MNDTDLISEIKNHSLSGAYFFYGDEDYMKNYRSKEIGNATLGDDPTFASFNSFELCFGDGELDLSKVSDALLAPPMMSERKFVSIYFPDLDSLKDKEKKNLVELISRDLSDDTVLVIRAASEGFDPGTAKKPSSFLASAMKTMKCVEFPYQPLPRLVRWIERHCADYGVTVENREAEEIIARAGRGMYRLTGEISKVAAYAAANGRNKITSEDIALCVTLSPEEDAFKLSNSIIEGNTTEALRSLAVKIAAREEPIYILTQITRIFTDIASAGIFILDGREKADFAKSMKIHEYRAGMYYRAARQTSFEYLRSVTELCAEADLRLKSGAQGYGPIEVLICAAAENRHPPQEETIGAMEAKRK